MYAKIFTQIFDSSIANDYQVRHVFEDLLKLSNVDGVVDMTIEAVSRRTNVPLEIVQRGIAELMKPDDQSRTHDHQGRRLLPLDPDRSWGWIIVNYQYYRDLQDEEARRLTWRLAARKQRAKAKQLKRSKPAAGEMAFEKAVENGTMNMNGTPVVPTNQPAAPANPEGET